MNSLTCRSRLKKDLWSKFRLGPKVRTEDGHNPESASKIKADPRSVVFSKSANPLDLQHKSTIRALFKAKSVDPKTYSPPSINKVQNSGALEFPFNYQLFLETPVKWSMTGLNRSRDLLDADVLDCEQSLFSSKTVRKNAKEAWEHARTLACFAFFPRIFEKRETACGLLI